MSKVLIGLKNLSKVFQGDEVETHALSDISFTINENEYVSISGPSGCGKSTLLSLIGLLDTPSGGEYKLAGYDVSDIDKAERARIRNKEVGFIFQSFNLISDLSVEDNVELPLTYRDGISKEEARKLVDEALKKVNMDHRKKYFPSQLSGGQQQRVAIARAIAGKPSLLLADEPTGNLDSTNAEAVMALLDELHADGSTICIVTHDPRSASRAQRSIEISDGKVLSDGRAKKPTSSREETQHVQGQAEKSEAYS
ncbi:ABC transporter ATP-binding protein [Pseudoalteromonas luteoviolacea]|uniref:ABC transporter ATP-binding protein n=1 Tax=Pseudoalteromonas luteoviolacea TaxID=43657 RepID=UPI001B396430|nr:ABC transporter ATP-binding protein [Pseudoalteromonas luteoviolacea]MBQ4813847.1 ABC transporter ATP-binding protein [Pseudoalteromonas luteoviolacea]